MSENLRFPHLSLADTNAPYMEELCRAASDVIRSGQYVGGHHVASLTHAVCDMCHTPFAVGTGNGLDALRLILMAYIEVGILHKGDEVIVPANTYVASFLAITQAGLKPKPVDPDICTMNLSGEGVSKALTPHTKAIMPVHLYGRVAWDEKLLETVVRHKLIVVEDVAQALGAKSPVEGMYGTDMAGSLGNCAGLSFYPTKNLGAVGDAGMALTHDSDIADAIKALANYGSDRRYHNIYAGINSRLDPIQAAMLMVKLSHLDEITLKRIALAEEYDNLISNPIVIKPLVDYEHPRSCVWHQYVLRVPGCRDQFREYMHTHGVGTDVHYPTPPHLQPCYKGMFSESLPITELLAQEVVSLPISEALSHSDIAEISRIINNFRK